MTAPRIDVRVAHAPVICFALEQAGQAINDVVVDNRGEETVAPSKLSVELGPDLGAPPR